MEDDLQEEITAISAIYGDDFKYIGKSKGRPCVCVLLKPVAEDGENYVGLNLSTVFNSYLFIYLFFLCDICRIYIPERISKHNVSTASFIYCSFKTINLSQYFIDISVVSHSPSIYVESLHGLSEDQGEDLKSRLLAAGRESIGQVGALV